MENKITVGLFGTCGGSTWRDAFMAVYDARGISYFNPQVDNWTPEMADNEAQHLVEDDIILFPVIRETTGIGSLAETGFAMVQAAKAGTARYFVFLVDTECDPAKVTDPVLANESRRARALVRAHLRKNTHPNVFVCDTLDQMLSVSINLHKSIESIRHARHIINTGS